MENSELIKLAKNTREKAYAPISKYKVGAVLQTKQGNVYLGCNVEDSSTRAGSCAERVAIFNAIANSSEDREFEKIVLVGGYTSDKLDKITPCGTCRQLMSEFCKPDFEIINFYIENGEEKTVVYKLENIFPQSFTIKKI